MGTRDADGFPADGEGPVREIHGGSGYWSQDSAVQVLAMPKTPTALWVRWPGGRVTTTPVSPNSKEVSINFESP